MKMTNTIKNNFYNLVTQNNSFIVSSHISPDGDSLGSMLAMTRVLSQLNKKVVPIVNDDIPKKFNFLPGVELIKREEDIKVCDVFISLDCADEDRMGFKGDLREYANKIINIDHHKSNFLFGDLNIVDINASSTGEVIYRLLDGKINIDYDIALCLFTSIVTDTGSLRYANTTSRTFRISADLVDKGVKPDFVSRNVFEQKSLESIKLLTLALNTLEVLEKGEVACISVTRDMLQTCGAKEEDTDGIVNYAREIEGVEVALLFKEQADSTVKVGLRSNEWVDVRRVAERFGGGGHIRAAGCSLKLSLSEAKKAVLNTVQEFLIEDINYEGNN